MRWLISFFIHSDTKEAEFRFCQLIIFCEQRFSPLQQNSWRQEIGMKFSTKGKKNKIKCNKMKIRRKKKKLGLLKMSGKKWVGRSGFLLYLFLIHVLFYQLKCTVLAIMFQQHRFCITAEIIASTFDVQSPVFILFCKYFF